MANKKVENLKGMEKLPAMHYQNDLNKANPEVGKITINEWYKAADLKARGKSDFEIATTLIEDRQK